ncbi:MAG: hypothetical protein ACOY40_17855 [Bacillota bacterium]
MLPIVFCDCGHQEYVGNVEKVGGKRFCKKCWKAYKEAIGEYQNGCIFPEVAICQDREPIYVDINYTPEERAKILSKARCYRGYDLCNYEKQSIDGLMNIVGQVIDGQEIRCPKEGCGQALSVVRTKTALTSICPIHGVVFRAILYPEEEGD